MMNKWTMARGAALALPVVALATALTSQHAFGLAPCEMCHWQRWPHYAALSPAVLAFILPGMAMRRTLVALAAFLVAISGVIGLYHAGVEYHLWAGLTTCSGGAGRTMADIMAAPLTRCDAPAFTLFGISMAGYNALFSLCGAGVVAWLLRGSRNG
ncbi:MAG: disulfide bond formation protein B [Sphingopyxis sp.]